jgi:hypothetical protein
MAPGMVELLVVPAAFEGIRAGDLSRLQIEERLRETIAEHLDQYRLLTTTLRVKEPRYLGVRVRAEILIGDYAQPEVVQARVDERLRHFITPLALEDGSGLTDEFLDPGWNGWPFGRDLYVSEIYSLIGQVPGVKHVWDVQIGYRPIVPGRKAAADDEPPNEADEGTLAPVEERRLQIPEDTLLCSLDHAIEVVEE